MERLLHAGALRVRLLPGPLGQAQQPATPWARSRGHTCQPVSLPGAPKPGWGQGPGLSVLRDISDAFPLSLPGSALTAAVPRGVSKSKVIRGPQECRLSFQVQHHTLKATQLRLVRQHRWFCWSAPLWAQSSSRACGKRPWAPVSASESGDLQGAVLEPRAIRCVPPPLSDRVRVISSSTLGALTTLAAGTADATTTSLACTAGTWPQPRSSSGKPGAL